MKDKIIENILQHLKTSGAPVLSLKSDDMLFETGILDSFTMVELISFVEETYQIRFNADDLVKENLETLDKLASLIETKKK